jgi:drug/metabolite transporter (DMT)-like permease
MKVMQQRNPSLQSFSPLDWILASILSLTWGSSFLLIAIAIEDLNPTLIPFGRAATGAVALAFFPGAHGKIPWRHWPRIASLGLVWMALPFWLFPIAERTVASSIAGMMNGGLPVVMACVTALWVRRMPSSQRIFAIMLGFGGIVVIALPAIRVQSTSGDPIADTPGVLYLVLALLCYAIGANIARPLQALYSPARLLMRVQFAAAIWTLPFAMSGARDSAFTMSAVAAVVALGVIGTGIAFVAFGTLLERTGITRAMIPTYFTPVVGLALGALFRSERIAVVSVLGMCIVIASAWLTSKPDDRDVMLSDTTQRH